MVKIREYYIFCLLENYEDYFGIAGLVSFALLKCCNFMYTS